MLERDDFLDTPQSQFGNLAEDGGHRIFISGEAGIGKTSLIKIFRKKTAGGDKTKKEEPEMAVI